MNCSSTTGKIMTPFFGLNSSKANRQFKQINLYFLSTLIGLSDWTNYENIISHNGEGNYISQMTVFNNGYLGVIYIYINMSE